MGSRGHLTPENRSRLSNLHKLCCPKVKFAKFSDNIFKTRNDTWTGAEYLMPVKQWIPYETLFFTILYLHSSMCEDKQFYMSGCNLTKLQTHLLIWMLLLVVYCQFILFLYNKLIFPTSRCLHGTLARCHKCSVFQCGGAVIGQGRSSSVIGWDWQQGFGECPNNWGVGGKCYLQYKSSQTGFVR